MHFNHADPDEVEPVDTTRDQTTACYVGSEHGKTRNFEFDDFGYDRNMSDDNEFDENFQELGSTLSAEVSGYGRSNQGDLEERVMLKRWFNEPVKDGPYSFRC